MHIVFQLLTKQIQDAINTSFPQAALKASKEGSFLNPQLVQASKPEFGDRSRTFAGLEDAIHAFEDKRLNLHDWIWVRFNGEVEDDDELEQPINSNTLEDGTRFEQWSYRRDRLDEEGALISRYILTTVGRVVMNHTIIDAVAAA